MVISKKAPRAVPDDDGEQLPFSPPAHWKDFDLADLETWDCPPLVPIVDGIIARSRLVYIAAETQTGKTLLGLYLARRCLTGGRLFGKYPITPVQTVWYLVLEDPAQRVQARLRDAQREFEREFPGLTVDRGRLVFKVIPGFALNDKRMWTWFELELQNATAPPDVVFLDTYQKATPGLNSFDDATQSDILHQLVDLTRRRDLTLLVNDHIRKGQPGKPWKLITIDDIKGTGGKGANSDAIILMQRAKNDRSHLCFQSSSKDWETREAITLRVAPQDYSEGMKFTYVADLTTAAAPSAQRSRGRPRVVLIDDCIDSTLQAGGEMSTAAIATALKASPSTTGRRLRARLKDGTLSKNGKGLYTLSNGGGGANGRPGPE